ncbi:hypothetical protein DPMN_031810 [Dreissena polymorpha]|uniref:Uncharacterized protein n=1 Tax=Dreissena polymorpha TaxID=45954 RepID=A0A9D4M3G8_DREPO|nr:hypothetical protein DPMN_031810 [Dreissena polymorpha]
MSNVTANTLYPSAGSPVGTQGVGAGVGSEAALNSTVPLNVCGILIVYFAVPPKQPISTGNDKPKR